MYYTINEKAAKTAHEMKSFFEYKEGKATSEYKSQVDCVAEIAEKKKAIIPDKSKYIDYLLDKYSKSLAQWYNTGFQIDMMCPSIMISGGSNFPVKKKEKQNSRYDRHYAEYDKIQKIIDKIERLGTGGIKSNDEKALEKLRIKLERLEEQQEMAKNINAYYRKNKTLEGCDFLTEKDISSYTPTENDLYQVPFPSWWLQNNKAKIKNTKKRIEELEKIKSAETTTENISGAKIVRNTEAVRIQIIFDEKPDEAVRNILKSNGFRWSPKAGAWQRQLNQNGEYALNRVIASLSNN